MANTTRVVMPQLGESVHEGTISKWLVKPGDKVVEFEPMLEVDTDKVNAEVPPLSRHPRLSLLPSLPRRRNPKLRRRPRHSRRRRKHPPRRHPRSRVVNTATHPRCRCRLRS